MKRRRPGQSLIFVVDEVGQFVARDVQKMLDLQAVVQSLGVKGRGKHWIVITSQEKLGELVSGLDDKKIELARLMDRFPLQVHLEPSDISEVTSRRVLSKSANAQAELGKLFDEHRGRLMEHTRLTADIRLPELTRDSFIDLYPLLPYQIDLIIQVVSGLRTQGGASKHVGGANRTIIKLAQQLLINPAVNLAELPLGFLSRVVRGKGQLSTVVSDPIDEKETDLPAVVLSSSQVNALAVSVFLALNIGVPKPPLSVAILDDPLQSLDDINLLGLVDLLRRTKDRRQLLVSTHDARFGALLSRKLRPSNEKGRTTVIELNGWTRLGPIVTTREVKCDPVRLRLVSSRAG